MRGLLAELIDLLSKDYELYVIDSANNSVLTATATCSQKHQIFIVGGWCYYTEGGRTTTASDESVRQMMGRHSSKINESGL